MAYTAMFVSTAMQVGAQYAQGKAQERAAEYRAEQLETQALAARRTAEDQEAQTKQELRSVLATQRAMFAARGVDPGSAVAVNIARDTERAAQRDVTTIRSQSHLTQRQLRQGAAARRREGRAARTRGLLNAGATVGGGVFRYSRLGSAPRQED